MIKRILSTAIVLLPLVFFASCNDTLTMSELIDKMNEAQDNSKLAKNDKDKPVLSVVEVAKTENTLRDKSGLYSSTEKLQLEAFHEQLLNAEIPSGYHTNSVWIHAKGNDRTTGIKYLKVTEKLLKTVEGKAPAETKTASGIAGLNQMGESNFAEGWFKYNFAIEEDGVVEFAVSAVDFAGNESLETFSFYVLKDTVIETDSFQCYNNRVIYYKPAESVSCEDKLVELASTVYININDDVWYGDGTKAVTNYAEKYSKYLKVFCGYSSDSIEKELEIKKDGTKFSFAIPDDYTGDRDLYLKTVVSDEAGNSVDLIRILPKRPQVLGSWNYNSTSYAIINNIETPQSLNITYLMTRYEPFGANYLCQESKSFNNSFIPYQAVKPVFQTKYIHTSLNNPEVSITDLENNKYSNITLYSFPADFEAVKDDSLILPVVDGQIKAVSDSKNSGNLILTFNLTSNDCSENPSGTEYYVYVFEYSEENSFVYKVQDLNNLQKVTIPAPAKAADAGSISVMMLAVNGNNYKISDRKGINYAEVTDNVPPVYSNEKSLPYSIDSLRGMICPDDSRWNEGNGKYYYTFIPYQYRMGTNVNSLSEDELASYNYEEFSNPEIPFSRISDGKKYLIAEKRYDSAGNFSYKGLMFADRSIIDITGKTPLKTFVSDAESRTAGLVSYSANLIYYDMAGYEDMVNDCYIRSSYFDTVTSSWVDDTETATDPADTSVKEKDTVSLYKDSFYRADRLFYYNFKLNGGSLGVPDVFRKVTFVKLSDDGSKKVEQCSRPVYFRYNGRIDTSTSDLTTKKLIDSDESISIVSEYTVLVQTVYSKVNYGDNISDWLTYCAGDSIVEEKVINYTANIIPDVSKIPEGAYYVVIAHFTNGISDISKVRQKK